MEVAHRTWDPSTASLRTRTVLRTAQFKGQSPFWAEAVRVALQSRDDALVLTLHYQRSTKAAKDWHAERICVLSLPELQRVATATESRRWYAFVGKFQGAAIGLGFLACSNMKALEGLPQGGSQPLSAPKAKVDTKAPTIDEARLPSHPFLLFHFISSRPHLLSLLFSHPLPLAACHGRCPATRESLQRCHG